MTLFEKKVDFAVIVSVKNANPNGDPLNGNRPRENYDGFGEISDVCIKRKIRNRLQDMDQKIFVQSDDRAVDGFKSLKERADACKEYADAAKKNSEAAAQAACKEWIDVRSFGQVFAFKGSGKGDGVSIGVRGPVSVHSAFSLSPVDITSIQITKSVNSIPGDKKSSDTMGMKHRIDYGLYVFYGSINCQLAEKTGFSQEDADLIHKALISLFENDASSARPDGSMEVYKVYWWQHSTKTGQYSSAKVHRTLHVSLKEGMSVPKSIDDYEISYDTLDGLKPVISDGR
ncbi:MAG: type I-C CRISPR-associated protein Cas7/Csd2 [Streptococcaceae bacterium]|nr:type I-C CRISPR-associated protein Cas7/Csd2 [Streptococcaceae bacterium]